MRLALNPTTFCLQCCLKSNKCILITCLLMYLLKILTYISYLQNSNMRSDFFSAPFLWLKDLKVFCLLQVKLGPTYTFAIKGQSSAPSLDFSFSRHNFGKCLLYRPGMVPASFTLVISNKGKKDVGYCFFFVFFTSLIYLPGSFVS